MRLFTFAAISFFCAAPIVVGSADEIGRIVELHQSLNQYSQADWAEREVWLRALFDRTLPAAEAALELDALRDHQIRTSAILERARQGKQLSEHGLVQLLQDLDRIEDAAIQRLSRQYRHVLRSAFPGSKHDAARRWQAWKSIAQNWRAAGSRAEDRAKLVGWLSGSISIVTTSGIARLPARPKFDGEPGYASRKRALPNAPPLKPRVESLLRAATSPNLVRHAGLRAPLSYSRPRKPSLLLAHLRRYPRMPVVQLVSRRLPAKRFALWPIESRARQIASPVLAVALIHEAARPANAAIDTDELTARVAGYELAIARLTGRLQDRAPWTVEQLSVAIEELEELYIRRSDLLLYWRLLSDAERLQIGKLKSPLTATSLLGSKIFASRELAQNGSADQRHVEIELLNELSRRLATMGAPAPAGE